MKGKLFWSLRCYFRLHTKELIYIELFDYLIEKESILKRKKILKEQTKNKNSIVN